MKKSAPRKPLGTPVNGDEIVYIIYGYLILFAISFMGGTIVAWELFKLILRNWL